MKGYHKGRHYAGEAGVYLTICMESLMYCIIAQKSYKYQSKMRLRRPVRRLKIIGPTHLQFTAINFSSGGHI